MAKLTGTITEIHATGAEKFAVVHVPLPRKTEKREDPTSKWDEKKKKHEGTVDKDVSAEAYQPLKGTSVEVSIG